jgi:Mn-dependent DtxR family transcriptional regulator
VSDVTSEQSVTDFAKFSARGLIISQSGVQFTQVKFTVVNFFDTALMKSDSPALERDKTRDRTLGKATGDVLKAMHTLQGLSLTATPDELPHAPVALPSDIAARTGTSRAFVTKMLQTMEKQGLVTYSPYQGARLTVDGRNAAVELSRHHRLLERFLTDILGFAPHTAHEEAERLEHVISEEFEARLAAFLQHPDTCPHGAPIPNADGTMPTKRSVQEAISV